MSKNTSERRKITEAMQRFGGSFIKALGVAASKADPDNYKKLEEAFPEYWAAYKRFTESDRGK